MEDLRSFYQGRINNFEKQLSRIKEQLFVSSMLRLTVFAMAFFLIYFFFGNARLSLAIGIAAIVLFLFLVSRHTDLQYKRDELLALLKINHTEIEVLDRSFHHLPEGNEYKDPAHFYSQDIDLFGRGSFYQYCNRTTLKEGSDGLAKILTSNNIENISQKQDAVRELSQLPEWRQQFSAESSLVKTMVSTADILKWLKDYNSFTPRFLKWLPTAFTIASMIIGLLYFLKVAPGSVFLLWAVLGLLISGIYMKKITKLGSAASKIQSTFEQYNKLLIHIETVDFKSELLNERKKSVLKEGKATSAILKQFSKLLNNLDQNHNVFFLLLGNGFFLRALATSYQIEQWISMYGGEVETWFSTVAFFDAYNALGNFAFNHPDYTFPKVSREKTVLKSSGAGHPLLDPEKCVLNDFQIDSEQFFIITGANMAGKSTFLRTVFLQIMMANVGLPIYAKNVIYTPIKLITSMRTTDSLTDDESYFFSELKRLKFIVNEIHNDRYFIVLDEILKGTNSTDKAKGSRKFVERLVSSKSTGIIATHDLSLCEVANELPQIENHYFDAEIIDNELYFDYKFKQGVCQNMNASFLLKKMDIIN